MVNKKDGMVVINCDDVESRDVIEKEAKDKMGNDYDILVPQLKKPCLLVCGINCEWDQVKFENAIKKQNKIEGSVKCLKLFNAAKKNKKNENIYKAIIEIESLDYKEIINKGSLNIGWDRCFVFDFVPVKRCFNCWGFNHEAKNCTKNVVCARCSEQHDT